MMEFKCIRTNLEGLQKLLAYLHGPNNVITRDYQGKKLTREVEVYALSGICPLDRQGPQERIEFYEVDVKTRFNNTPCQKLAEFAHFIANIQK